MKVEELAVWKVVAYSCFSLKPVGSRDHNPSWNVVCYPTLCGERIPIEDKRDGQDEFLNYRIV